VTLPWRLRPRLPALRWHLAGGVLGLGLAAASITVASPMLGTSPGDSAPAAPGSTTAPGTATVGSPVAVPFAGNPELKARLDNPGILTIAGERLNADLLRRFYGGHGYQTVWDTRQAQAGALWALVMHAGSQGLDPDAFHANVLSRQGANLSPVERDLLTTDAFLAYSDALARGGVPIEQRDDDEDLTPETVDVVAVLDAALAGSNPAQPIEALAPNAPEYATLRRAYAGYQAIAQAGGWPRIGESGRDGSRLQQLQQRLAAEGYLPAGYFSAAYDDTTVRAVRSFQEHHGLDVDGRLNPATVTELNVPADARARQVAVNLERLRWLPRALPLDRVWVNAANARLQLFRGGQVAFTTRVVVGEVDKQTPEFQADIVSVLFNPPWNVPYSIASKEILPKLSAQPDYLSHHHMTIRGNGTVQQEPGPGNALGQLKFEMPNRYDVYLHDTPLKNLFSRDNRRISHGCVRVENPRVLASLLLDQPLESINKGIALVKTNRHMLPAALPVFIVYQTAYADPDGSIQFRRDFYERDDEIWQHLTRSPQMPVAQETTGSQRKG